MPIILAAAAAALCIASIHDGDTVRLCDGERVRLLNIDAPELAGSPRCSAKSRARLEGSDNPSWCDFKTGIESRDQLRAFLAAGPAMIHRSGTDRYGRTLARLSVNGKDAGEYLIRRGLARPWRK
ncbi:MULTISPECIES: thermonuclease family protein [unclassified Novosphingobium]|uniref:thermonuclease family protein n=1 Tax=unclassified Novosphingobium TaxID=2644732 RepID=UPI001358D4CC|nr:MULTISPECIES: thermonuclease family protein [unclassified Novosphingobium]